jgi:hypothetical protein
MSVGAINIAIRGMVLNYSVGSVNLLPWVHHDTWSRCSLAPVLLAECQEKNVYTRHNYLM